MLVERRVEFIIKSLNLSPAEIEATLGIAADAMLARGSRRPEVPLPRAHLWRVIAEPASTIETEISTLVARLEPVRETLREICNRPDSAGYLTIFRYFRRSDEEAGFGFGIDSATLAFLSDIGAEIDIDEYNYSEGD